MLSFARKNSEDGEPLAVIEAGDQQLVTTNESILSESAGNRMTIEDEISLTEKRMREFESAAKYLDAERERQRLEKLKSHIKNVKQLEMKKTQEDDCKHSHYLARQQQSEFDKLWESTFGEHTRKTQELHEAIQTRHEEQLKELREQLEKKIRTPRYSTNLLTLRKKQYMLGKCQRYLEAENIKRNADIMETKELEEHKKQCQKENQYQLDQLLEQHLLEMRALRQKMELERKNLMEIRNQDQEKLQFRLRKSAVELKKSHTRQKLQASGALTSTAGFATLNSAPSSTSRPLSLPRLPSVDTLAILNKASSFSSVKKGHSATGRDGMESSHSSRNLNSSNSGRRGSVSGFKKKKFAVRSIANTSSSKGHISATNGFASRRSRKKCT